MFFSVVSVNLPKNPEEDASEHLNRSARFARCARSLAALAEGILFSLWRRVVSSAFGKATKHLRKIYASDLVSRTMCLFVCQGGPGVPPIRFLLTGGTVLRLGFLD